MGSKILNLQGLKEHIDARNPVPAKEQLQSVSTFFESNLTKAELELALEVLFNINSGTIAFLRKSIKDPKVFQDSNVIIFDIWISLIQIHHKNVDYIIYADLMIECCIKFILSNEVSAKEKEKSAIVLQELFLHKYVDNIDLNDVLDKILQVFYLKTKQTKFLQQIYRLLGIISEKYPETMMGTNSDIVLNAFLKTLESALLAQETIHFYSLTGAMEGLNHYLVHFAPDDKFTIDRIYSCIKKLSSPQERDKAAFRASIEVFTKHCMLFANNVFLDFNFWHDCLSKWLTSKIIDDRRRGVYAMQAFHAVIVAEMSKDFGAIDMNMLRFLINYFLGMLESTSAQPHEIRISIRGFGLLSEICRLLQPESYKKLLSLVIQRTELIAIVEDNALRDSLEHFPDYVQALSQIISSNKENAEVEILAQNIQSILVRLIRDFHYLSMVHTRLVITSVSSTFCNLSKIHGTIFEETLEKVILEGIIWTCSHKLVYDANEDWADGVDWKDNITFKSYLPFWYGLLAETENEESEKAFTSRLLFDMLITSLYAILEKLNLQTERRIYKDENGQDQEFHFCDPNIDLCPVKPRDYHIFFNLVEFYKCLFEKSKFKKELFRKWMKDYCMRMIGFAVKNPLVSGFLKLLEVGLIYGDSLNYFTNDCASENDLLQIKLRSFLKSTLIKCQRVPGELQVSCLEFILKYPVQLYNEYLLDLIPVFVMAFDIGKSIISLADLAMTSLEKISQHFCESRNDLTKLYLKVLPCLDTFLESTNVSEDFGVEYLQFNNRRRVRKTIIQKSSETELLKIQKRILLYLGKIEPENARLLIAQKQHTNLMKWHIEQSVRLKLYYPGPNGINPTIILDAVIPRICDLAITSSDRKTKVNACEIVHGLVLYMLGSGHHKGRMWKELLRRSLILACDRDQTVNQIFEPLLIEITHIISKNEFLSTGVTELIEVLMDGISNTSHTTIRDTAARAIREFVEWSIKHSSAAELITGSTIIEMILDSLKIYSYDSDLSKRIGAALCFNNLYRILREQNSICDRYFVDFLYTFCINFQLTEETTVAVGENIISDLDQVSKSVDHIVRVLKERNNMFNRSSKHRIRPYRVNGDITLKDVILFLFRECGSKSMNYRSKCIDTIKELVPRTSDNLSVDRFLEKYGSINLLAEICEGIEELENLNIKAKPTLKYIENPTEISIYVWLQHLLCSLDCYCWLLSEHAIQNRLELFKDSKIFIALSYFLTDVIRSKIFELLNGINSKYLNDSCLSQIETDIFTNIDYIKSIIVVRIMDFIAILITENCVKVIPDAFWSDTRDSLIAVITDFIFQPQQLMIDTKSPSILKSLSNFLKAIELNSSNSAFLEQLRTEIADTFFSNLNSINSDIHSILYSDNVSDYKKNMIIGIVFALKHSRFLWNNKQTSIQLTTIANSLITKLFVGIKRTLLDFDYAVNLAPEIKQLANKIMEFCFATENFSVQIIKFILDETELKVRGTNKSTKHGDHFFHIYKSAIFGLCDERFYEKCFYTLLTQATSTNFIFILKCLISFSENLYKYRRQDRMLLEKITDICLTNILAVLEKFSDPNNDLMFVEFISRTAMISPFPLKRFKESCPKLEEWILSRLSDKNLGLENKSKIIILLPIITGPENISHELLSSALDELQRQHLPLKSSEFPKNSLEETGLKSIYTSLLQSLVASQSIVILEFLIRCTASDEKHILEWMIHEQIDIFMKNLNLEQQQMCLNAVFKIIRTNNLEASMRYTLLNRFMITLLRAANEESRISFYVENISSIIKLTDTNYSFARTGRIVEQAIVNRIIGFTLIEVMMGTLPEKAVKGKESPIARAALDNNLKTGNELVGMVTKKSFEARKEIFVPDDNKILELVRKYQCAAYRVTCVTVCNTQKELRFYSKLIFEEDTVTNAYIWKRIINCIDDNLYMVDEQELQNYTKMKQRFVFIRQQDQNVESNYRPKYRHIQTQNIFESSLSMDMSKVDLNYSVVRTNDEVLLFQQKNVPHSNISINLENHKLNSHEVMSTLCGVIKHMFENGITPALSEETASRKYSWVTSIADAMTNRSNHKNIRIFLARVIDNCRDIFKHYARWLFRPILEVLVDECAGGRLSYFVTDLIALILSWCSTNLYKATTVEEGQLVSALLKFFIRNAWHEKKEIFKYNIELLYAILITWKDIVTIPSQLLYDMITKSQQVDKRENECGIVILGVVLANGFVPWTETTKVHFINEIMFNLKNNYVTVYQPSSEVLGMALCIIREQGNQETLDDIHTKVVEIIRGFKRKNDKKFSDILYGIHKKYPEIINDFLQVISFEVSMAAGAQKKIYLEMLLSRIEKFGKEAWNELQSIGIKDLMKNSEYQLLALHTLNRCILFMDESDIDNIFSTLVMCLESIREECRDVAYEILIYIAKNFKGDVRGKAESRLLKALMDNDAQIQKRIFQYWSNETNFSTNVEERLIDLLSNTSINCESQFLGFCAQLILEPAIQHSESKSQLFPNISEANTKFTEYSINTKLRDSSSHTLRPLFAEPKLSMRGSFLGSNIASTIQNTAENYFFEPTQDPTKFTQPNQSFTLPTQSLLLFGNQPQKLNRRSQKIEQPAVQTENNDVDSLLSKYRRRFIKDSETEQRTKTLDIIGYKSIQRAKKINEAKEKGSHVVLYRRYRIGDYPDLFINALALLMPLQGLVKRDKIIARQILVSAFDSVLKELGPESKMFINSISDSIQRLLENSKNCDPTVFATFLEIALLRPQHFNIPPETVAMISKATNALTIGAVYLEERLICDWNTDSVSAKTSSSIGIEDKHWLYLSDIHHAMADYDIVATIFSDKIKTDPRLGEAIELKADGDFKKAQELLIKVIERCVQVEHHYAYNCYYECFLEMGMWSELSQAVQQQVDNFEELWSDDYNITFLLPHLVQAEVQNILNGYSEARSFLNVLEAWMQDSFRQEYIRKEFCEELMMLLIANQDYLQARVYCENYLNSFLADWRTISVCNEKLRLKNLLRGQRVAEIHQYASYLIDGFNEKLVEQLEKRWSDLNLNSSDSLSFWNSFILYRTYIAATVIDMVQNSDSEVNTDKLRDVLYDMDFKLFNVAIQQKNCQLSEKILSRLSPLEHRMESNLNIRYKIAEIKQKILKIRYEKRINDAIIFEVWSCAQQLMVEDSLELNTELLVSVTELNGQIGETILENIIHGNSINLQITDQMKFLTAESDAEYIYQRIFDQSLFYMKWSAESADKLIMQSLDYQKSTRVAANCYYRVAQFCYDQQDNENLQKSVEIDKIFITSLFRAMKYNSKEAKQLFPCVLKFDCLQNGTLEEHFKEESLGVPEWVFLPWIPQILSRIDFTEPYYLDDLILRIASNYPDAIRYPFYVWLEIQKSMKNTIVTSLLRDTVAKLYHILIEQSPISSQFIKCLATLCMPEILLQNELEKLYSKCISCTEQSEFESAVNLVIKNVFEIYSNQQGPLFVERIADKQKLIAKLKSQFNIKSQKREIQQEIQKLIPKRTREKEQSLEQICPWMANFHWCEQERYLELPGQYNIDQRPNMQNHVKIVKFKHKLQILQSQRRPLKLVANGSNGKSYAFLIKHGEDLRQDQRIQQISRLISDKLNVDRKCRHHGLEIKTFKVIPITIQAGMIEWVPNTLPMMEFISKHIPDYANKIYEINKQNNEFLKITPNEKHFLIYGRAVDFYTKEQILNNFNKLKNIIDAECLRKAFVNLSISPEAFYVIRNKFCASLATMSIIHYVLGIGDRHLGNILISEQDCSLTGIDFGYAFGTGVLNLQVPELIPFRLTPQFVSAMNPMGTSGLLRECMIHTMRTLRNNKKLLIACMDVFVHEPMLDWLTNVRQDNTNEPFETHWTPSKRIDIAKRKLLGHHPCKLLEEELSNNMYLKNFTTRYLDGYKKILHGHEQFNIRYRLLKEETLKVEDQVKCLIDLATDPIVLGISFSGLLPWI